MPVEAMYIIVEGSVGLFKAHQGTPPNGMSRVASFFNQAAPDANGMERIPEAAQQPSVAGIDAFQVRQIH